MTTTAYSFCESTFAGPNSPWHIRKLTTRGQKLGGGIDTDSLCGHVKAPMGWDLNVKMTPHHLTKNTCRKCVSAYEKALEKDT